MVVIVGFEGSANKFGVGIIRDGEVLSNPRDTYISPPGTGFRPPEAAQHHRDVALRILKQALDEAKVNIAEIDAIAYTMGPGKVVRVLQWSRTQGKNVVFSRPMSKFSKTTPGHTPISENYVAKIR